MSTELVGVVVMYGLTVLLAIPLGKYIANVFKPESANGPIERFIYRLAGIDSSRDMTWKKISQHYSKSTPSGWHLRLRCY